MGYSWTTGLVDEHGRPMSVLNGSTWGINMATCEAYCNNNRIPYPLFNFQTFSSCFTNYFLPWLALTAQLPYETGDFWSNCMSFCLAVGSPALVTYSLTVTIMNRVWARKAFDELRDRADREPVKSRCPSLADRLAAAQIVLQEGQQAPLRVSQKDDWLSSLVVLPQNKEWWDQLEITLKNTRRGVTASLVAQMSFAIIAYMFTIIASYKSQFGDPTIALQIASGSLWLWLIPVIIGWITVGTQFRANTIKKALETRAHRAHSDRDATGEDIQEGLIFGTGLSPLPLRNQTGLNGHDIAVEEHKKISKWLGCKVEGDELRQGPIYNYARVFTWWQVATILHTAFEKTVQNVAAAQRCRPAGDGEDMTWVGTEREDNLRGDSQEIAKYCALPWSRNMTSDMTNDTTPRKHVVAYPNRKEISSSARRHIYIGIMAALWIQLGTTAASILIAYLTPTKGWGCRSGSYALYGILATTVFICLWSSTIASHRAMLIYQEAQVSGLLHQYKRTLMHNFLCGMAVVLRRLGKSLAIFNAWWLIVSSVLEFIGVFDNCWCLGDHLGLGSDGWVVLFKNGADLAVRARGAWDGGLALTLAVCFAAAGFFAVGSWTSYSGS